MCLELLRINFDNHEAHALLLEVFHALGFKNEVVLRTREQLKELLVQPRD